jgi:replicative DNA helicase
MAYENASKDLSEYLKNAMPGMTAQQLVKAIDILASSGVGDVGPGDCVFTGIDEFDRINVPLTKGRMALIIGETGQGKSPIAKTIANNISAQIAKAGRKSVVMTFLTEDTVQKHALSSVGAATAYRPLTLRQKVADIEAIKKRVGELRQIVVGDAFGAEQLEQFNNNPNSGEIMMTPNRIAHTVASYITQGVEIEAIIIDHIHDLFPDDPFRSEQERYDSVGNSLVRLGVMLRQICPLIMCGQVNKNVEDRPWVKRMPSPGDLKYMAAVAQKAADIYAITHPAKYMDDTEKEKNFLLCSNGTFDPAWGTHVVQPVKMRDGQGNPRVGMTGYNAEGQWTGLLSAIKRERVEL